MSDTFVFSNVDSIVFAEKVFVLTGFSIPKDVALQEEILQRGGTVQEKVEYADYLVVQENNPRQTSTYIKALDRLEKHDDAFKIVASSQVFYYLNKETALPADEREEYCRKAQQIYDERREAAALNKAEDKRLKEAKAAAAEAQRQKEKAERERVRREKAERELAQRLKERAEKEQARRKAIEEKEAARKKAQEERERIRKEIQVKIERERIEKLLIKRRQLEEKEQARQRTIEEKEQARQKEKAEKEEARQRAIEEKEWVRREKSKEKFLSRQGQSEEQYLQREQKTSTLLNDSRERRKEGYFLVDTDAAICIHDMKFLLHAIKNADELSAIKKYIVDNNGVILQKVTPELDYLILDAGYNRETDAYRNAVELREQFGWPRIITVDRFFRLSDLYLNREETNRILDVHSQELKKQLLCFANEMGPGEYSRVTKLINSMSAADIEAYAIELELYDPVVNSQWQRGNYAFISHASKNKSAVKEILRSLNENGYLFWYDEGLTPGEIWHDTIMARLDTCTQFIAMLSKEFWESYYCCEELEKAYNSGKNIVLLQLDDTPVDPDFEKITDSCTIVDYFGDLAYLFEELSPFISNVKYGNESTK